MAALLPALVLACLLASASAGMGAGRGGGGGGGGGGAGRVVTLTDLNFDRLVNGSDSWMVAIYAPWCGACQEMAQAWEELAERLHPGVLVGKVDGTQERGLLRRFHVTHYPSVYHLTPGGAVRDYAGVRTAHALERFARHGWESKAAITGCSSPLSVCGRAIGAVTQVPARVKHAYFRLREESQYSDLALLSGIMAVPVAVGLGAIFALDLLYRSRAAAAAQQQPHPHAHHE